MVFLLFFVFTSLDLVHSESNSCSNTSPNFIKPLTAQTINHFIRINSSKVTSPRDLMCCIVKSDPTLKIITMHNSLAAQNGNPKNPRVLIVKTTPNGEDLETVFSINSGHQKLGQHSSVEMIEYTSSTSDMTMSDIEFTPEGFSFHKNPENCISCHGDKGEMPRVGGLKTLFERDPWFRVSSPNAIFKSFGCPNYQNKLNQMRSTALSALSEQEQYECIKNLPHMSVTKFDELLARKNDIRVGKILRSTKDYYLYKYAIAGSIICPSFLPEEFIPKKILETMTQQDTIKKDIIKLNSKEQLVAITGETPDWLKTVQHADRNMQFDLNSNVTLPEDLISCRKQNKLSEKHFPGANSTYHRYIADSYLRQSSFRMASFRFLLETRGIDISNWNMTVTEPYGRTPFLLEQLKVGETQSFISMLESKNCNELKKQSLEALTNKLGLSSEELVEPEVLQ